MRQLNTDGGRRPATDSVYTRPEPAPRPAVAALIQRHQGGMRSCKSLENPQKSSGATARAPVGASGGITAPLTPSGWRLRPINSRTNDRMSALSVPFATPCRSGGESQPPTDTFVRVTALRCILEHRLSVSRSWKIAATGRIGSQNAFALRWFDSGSAMAKPSNEPYDRLMSAYARGEITLREVDRQLNRAGLRKLPSKLKKLLGESNKRRKSARRRRAK
jgi:hypothetical protein